jgi:hypothetical protein
LRYRSECSRLAHGRSASQRAMGLPYPSCLFAPTPACRKGVNRVVWDLQMDRKHLFTSVDENELGQTQFVHAGTYKATVSIGDDKVEKSFRVLAAPDPEH